MCVKYGIKAKLHVVEAANYESPFRMDKNPNWAFDKFTKDGAAET